MSEKEEILKENIKEYTEFAERALKESKYNSATTLLFKAISAEIDLFILRNEGFVPTSHTQRFRIAQEKYPEVYEIMDKDFPFYQDSYTKKMSREIVEVFKEDVERIRKIIKK